MSIRKFVILAAMAMGLANAAGAAWAQKVYVIDEEAIRRGSKVGQLLAGQIGDLRTKGADQLGLVALQNEIKAEQAALAPQVQSLTPEAINANPALKARVEALAKKQQEFAGKANQLNGALDQQNTVYMSAFAQAMAPAVEFAAKAAGADVVVSSTSTWYFKPAQDLSAKVIQRLDATVPTLEALRALVQPAQPAGGAAAPAAPQPAAPPAPRPGTP